MDRRVVFALTVVLAGGVVGVGVGFFAFVGFDEATTEATIEWESDAEGSDEAALVYVDDEPRVVRSVTDGGECAVRALDAAGEDLWTTPVGDDCDAATGLATGEFDGDPVVAIATGDTLRVLDATDGTERFSASLDAPATAAPAIGDLTGDGVADLAVVDSAGTLSVVADGGETAWTRAVDGDVRLRPLVGNFTEGGDAEVAVAAAGSDGTEVSVFDAAGDPVWSETLDGGLISWTAAETRRGPVLVLGESSGVLTTKEADDGSSRYEVRLQDAPIDVGGTDAGRVAVGGTGAVWAVDLLDGEVVWKQQYGGGTRVNAPATADVTGDGTPEMVTVNRGGDAPMLNRDGEVVARGDAAAVVYSQPLTADLTGDGSAEVVLVTEDGRVIAMAV